MKTTRTVILTIMLLAVGYIVYRIMLDVNKEIWPTVSARKMDIERTLTIPGVILPIKEIEVKSSISGVLEELYVQVGDFVRQGQNIARVQYVKDPLEYQRLSREMEVTMIKYNKAKESFSGTESLYHSRLISKEEYQTEKSNVDVLESQYLSTTTELNMLKGKYQSGVTNIITATNSGVILELPVKEGGSVMARGTWNEGVTVARIADLHALVFKGNVSEADVLLLAPSMHMTLSLTANKDLCLSGVVSLIAPKGVVRENGVSYFEVTATIDVPDTCSSRIKAGCTANARAVIQRKTNVLALEEKYFQFDYDSIYVEVEDENGKFSKQFLQTGISDGIYTEIISGIDGRDRIKVKTE